MLVRKLSQGKMWRDILAEEPDISAMDLPSELFSEFAPSLKDKSWLSLYEIEDEAQCADVAAALSFLLKPGQASEQLFFAVKREDLEAVGLEIKANDGSTFHVEVDKLHREIYVSSMQSAASLVEVFLRSGDLVSAKGSQIEAARALAMRNGIFKIAEVALKPKINDNACGHILAHVAKGEIIPAGRA